MAKTPEKSTPDPANATTPIEADNRITSGIVIPEAVVGYGGLARLVEASSVAALPPYSAPCQLNEKHMAHLIEQSVIDAGLRAGLATNAKVDERHFQNNLATRCYRNRDRFRVNLTKTVAP